MYAVNVGVLAVSWFAVRRDGFGATLRAALAPRVLGQAAAVLAVATIGAVLVHESVRTSWTEIRIAEIAAAAAVPGSNAASAVEPPGSGGAAADANAPSTAPALVAATAPAAAADPGVHTHP